MMFRKRVNAGNPEEHKIVKKLKLTINARTGVRNEKRRKCHLVFSLVFIGYLPIYRYAQDDCVRLQQLIIITSLIIQPCI